MKIDLTELLREVGNEEDVEEVEEASYPEDGLVLSKPIKMKLHLLNAGSQVIVTGQAETEVELNCSRCLENFKQSLLVNIKENFEKDLPPVKGKKGGEIEIREEDFVSPIEKDNTIDISEVIRQNLLLALPIKPLCNPNCQEPKGQKDATT